VDNGKQFDSTDFKEFCTYLGTKLCFASVYHPQSNGVVERANGVIFASIKRSITDLPKSKWAEELPRVIWSHNTTTSRTTVLTLQAVVRGRSHVARRTVPGHLEGHPLR
jgi:transposase InsO family protein